MIDAADLDKRNIWRDDDGDDPEHARAVTMDSPYTAREIAGIAAGAVTSLVIVGWIVFLAIGILSAR